MRYRYFSCMLAGALLAGCMHFEPTIVANSAADSSSGYITGQVRMGLTRGLGYGFAIQSVDGGPEYLLSIGAAGHFKSAAGMEDHPVAIKVPPGTYKVVTWIVYQTLFNEARFRAPLKNDALIGKPFKVNAGSVVHLGNFDISVDQKKYGTDTHSLWKLTPLPFTQLTSKDNVAQTYPNLANLPFRCVVCLDTYDVPEL